ncbi:MAG: hypothetical protein SOT18_02660 [Eubacterium sp.]|nr:hypothetical protein [Eubacterium sp.]
MVVLLGVCFVLLITLGENKRVCHAVSSNCVHQEHVRKGGLISTDELLTKTKQDWTEYFKTHTDDSLEIKIGSVEDLKKVRQWMQSESNSWRNWNLHLEQMNDITVSRYTYKYIQNNHRIAIYYDGKIDVYYDVTDKKYYGSLGETKEVGYKWKTASWEAINSSNKGISYCYYGNGYKIEGLYQENHDTASSALTGVFRGADKVENLTINNFFAIGENIERQAVLGDSLGEVYRCQGENIEVISNAMMTGFIARHMDSECVQQCKVSADWFVFQGLSDEQSLGSIIGEVWANADNLHTVSNCESVGEIIATGAIKHANMGGIVGKRVVVSENEIENGYAISQCVNNTNIHMRGNDNKAGGICGSTKNGYINSCENRGQITAENSNVGGISGNMSMGVIINCINLADISVKPVNAGMVVGCIEGGENCIYNFCGYSKGVTRSVGRSYATYALENVYVNPEEDLETLKNALNLGRSNQQVLEKLKLRTEDLYTWQIQDSHLVLVPATSTKNVTVVAAPTVSPAGVKKQGNTVSKPVQKKSKSVKKWSAPSFSLKNKKAKNGQKYVLIRLKKYKGAHVEVWVKIGKRPYQKLKLTQNKIKKLKKKLKLKYSFHRKKLYFKLRTYQIKNKKKVYSKKSKGKRIVTA